MSYLLTIGLILLLLLVWIIVEASSHLFARNHPEFGPPRKMGCGGCGNSCAGHCVSDDHEEPHNHA